MWSHLEHHACPPARLSVSDSSPFEPRLNLIPGSEGKSVYPRTTLLAELHRSAISIRCGSGRLTAPDKVEIYSRTKQWPVKSKAHPKRKSSSPFQSTLVCPNCYQWLQPDNHRMRLRPKPRPSAKVQSVLRRRARGKRLSLVQKNLLHRFQKSSSVLMATCHACNTTSRHKGMNRDFIAALAKTHSTPGSAGKHKTPQSTNRGTPKTPGKDKTPSHTPRGSTSSTTSGTGSSSSSKSSSKPKNWVVQRLSKILMREDTQGSKKGGLKDFLSSL